MKNKINEVLRSEESSMTGVGFWIAGLITVFVVKMAFQFIIG